MVSSAYVDSDCVAPMRQVPNPPPAALGSAPNSSSSLTRRVDDCTAHCNAVPFGPAGELTMAPFSSSTLATGSQPLYCSSRSYTSPFSSEVLISFQGLFLRYLIPKPEESCSAPLI